MVGFRSLRLAADLLKEPPLASNQLLVQRQLSALLDEELATGVERSKPLPKALTLFNCYRRCWSLTGWLC
jgi:hypothetical protein